MSRAQSVLGAAEMVSEVLDAENALLGILLCQPELTAEVARTLSPFDFYGADRDSSVAACIFQHLVKDSERGVRTEPHVLTLQLADELKALGGGAHVGNLISTAGSPSVVPELVRQLATSAAQRRIVRSLARPSVSADEFRALLQAETARADELSVRGRAIRATPYRWIDPRSIPTRAWLYDRHFIRGFVSGTFAPGGVGKTMLAIVEALAMATGRPLLGVRPAAPLTVWLINLEDPREELERRVAAACLHYGIIAEEVEGRLFIDSGREAEIVVARSSRNGVEVCTPVVRQLEREIKARQVDALIVDPFVACHEVPENDNGAVNVVVKQWRALADITNCAIDLIHHTRKANQGQGETTVEDGRGASALLSGVRSARVLNPMSEQQAAEWGIEERRLFFRVDNGKANLAPPASRAKWQQLMDIDLENGTSGFSDRVGVPAAWEPPSAFESVTNADIHAIQQRVSTGEYRASEQASAWVGYAVAEVLRWDISSTKDKARVKSLLKAWLAGGVLRIEQRQDPKKREPKPFVTVGTWVQP